MRQSKLHIKTSKEAPADEVAKNAILLTRAGYVHKEMAGVYTYLALGKRTLDKIENIVRKHMDTIGAEVLMSSLAPKEIWQATGRIDSVDVLMKTSAANEESKNKSGNEYILNSTHEEMITPIAKEYLRSYKDLPAAYYQVQTKFRNEARAKSGLLRGREFRMKDLYSFHTSESDLMEYYEQAKKVYLDVYAELGLGDDTFVTLASGGDFTKDFSHEFQTLTDMGEDEIYLDRKNNIAYNKEVVNEETENKLGVKFSEMEIVKACEVGNIFPLGTKFSKAIDYKFVDKDNEQKEVYMGSYGIGPSRVMGVITEKFADEKGLVWPKAIAPFGIHLVSLHREMGDNVYVKSEEIYKKLSEKYEVLWDDREGTVGAKLNDADLFGMPLQVIIGQKGLDAGEIEIKIRQTGEVSKVSFNEMYAKIDALWVSVF
jgi:prolyl-tRNA synthetase